MGDARPCASRPVAPAPSRAYARVSLRQTHSAYRRRDGRCGQSEDRKAGLPTGLSQLCWLNCAGSIVLAQLCWPSTALTILVTAASLNGLRRKAAYIPRAASATALSGSELMTTAGIVR